MQGQRCFWEEVVSELRLEVFQVRAFQAEGAVWAKALRWEIEEYGGGKRQTRPRDLGEHGGDQEVGGAWSGRASS